jgi:hypothetical protein
MFVGKLTRFEPIDRTAVSLMVLLSFAIGFLLALGDRSLPKVRDFSWECDRTVCQSMAARAIELRSCTIRN